MKDFETQLHTMGKMAREIGMTKSEKSLMRSHIDTFIKNNPLPIQKTLPIKSPYANAFGFMSFARAVAFVLVGVILGTTGVASASLQSLPGDTLYPIKTGVVEPITGAVLATTPEAKVSYEEKLVYKRLSEIEELRTKEMFDTKRSLVAQKAIAYQSERFNNAITSIEVDNATLAIEKSERVSDEFKRREDMLTGNTSSATLMMATAITSTDSDLEIQNKHAISDELKNHREKLNEKRSRLEGIKFTKEFNAKIQNEDHNPSTETIRPSQEESMRNNKPMQ